MAPLYAESRIATAPLTRIVQMTWPSCNAEMILYYDCISHSIAVKYID